MIKIAEYNLLLAIDDNSIETVDLLTDIGVNVNYKDVKDQGCTPLIKAVIKGNLRMVEILIKKGAIIDLSDNVDKCSPLIWAILYSRNEIISYLIDRGASVNQVNHYKLSPLMAAIEKNLKSTAVKLIERGAQINIKDSDNRTPLSIAIDNDNIELVKLLLEKGADLEGIDDRISDTLNENSGSLIKNIINNAKTNKAKSNIESNFFNAIINNQIDTFNTIIYKGININCRDVDMQTPLMTSLKHERYDMAKRLIKLNADINVRDKKGFTPLILSCVRGNIEISKLLIGMGANINAADYCSVSPLMFAAIKGNAPLVDLLISNGAYVSRKDNRGDTAATLAIGRGFLEIYNKLSGNVPKINFTEKIFYKNGNIIKPNPKAMKSTQRLFNAVETSDYNSAQTIICSCKIDFELLNSEGENIFTLAANKDDLQMIKLFIKHSISPSLKNKFLETPFLITVKRNNTKCSNALADYSSKILNTKDIEGYNAFYYAQKNGNRNLMEIILKINIKNQKFSIDIFDEITKIMNANLMSHKLIEIEKVIASNNYSKLKKILRGV